MTHKYIVTEVNGEVVVSDSNNSEVNFFANLYGFVTSRVSYKSLFGDDEQYTFFGRDIAHCKEMSDKLHINLIA